MFWTRVQFPPAPPESILDSGVAERSRDNFKDPLINCIPEYASLWGGHGFDRADEYRYGQHVSDDVKRRKTSKRKR